MPASMMSRRTKLGVGAALWTPASLANLVGWYKADALVLNDADLVASWVDSSGTGNTLTQATALQKPVFKTAIQNGLPVVRFAGGQNLNAANADYAQPNTIFVAGIVTAASGVFVTGATGGKGEAMYSDVSTGIFSLYAGLGATPGSTDIRSAWHSLAAAFDGVSSEARLDAASTTALSVGTHVLSAIRLGDNEGTVPSSFALNGDIGEVFIVNRHCTTSELNSGMAYLKTKWGTP